MRGRIITLLTDFGDRDGYVAAMKGVMLGIAPHARIVDISHRVSPFAIRSAAYLLAGTCTAFPSGTIHVAVVDPGVGTSRRALGIAAGGQLLIGPDNGVLSWAAARLGAPVAYAITNRAWMRPHLSRTFHGRDLFAPVAAHLAAGRSLAQVGRRVARFRRLEAEVIDDGHRLIGMVAHVDRFGNVITTLREVDLERRFGRRWLERVHCRIGRRVLRVAGTYAEAPTGTLVALIGSASHLEIAVNGGNAAHRLRTTSDLRVAVERVKEPRS